MTVAYCRVSTELQSNESQKRELMEFAKLKGWTIDKIYEDQSTGTNVRRPAFQQLMADAREGKFKRIIVWKIDRMSRSLKDLITTLQELIELKIEFVSLKDQIDLTTSAGRLMFNLLGSFAQFEAEIIRERTRSGLMNAKAKGIQLGTPSKLNTPRVRELRTNGLKLKQIAAQLETSVSSVRRALERAG